MNSLKKKFGKFAVSTEKMAKVTGGGYHTADCNGSLYAAATYEELYELVYEDGATNCTLVA
ncbi:hypothetical protein Fleli_2710 [Bernardetia litoralis DSM 6794]|uniref:Uncharacterized protein n=1 Tax=Bernardetia litoralis (strain ATCC 23117 / DSM 6794 / NBRC 15988 / NCIMB 1366 / Fx l1 / Sio-4) TaxID=880071 RepID=I4AM81_BERLS|nr:hypothetical protein [Bernardetia litoralis]AFM05066.1 hypothetical protein Fleli_2710 [Bernardetia litoralis DSM 6794]